MKARKDDQGKMPWEKMRWTELEQVVRVLEHGDNKYGIGNWKSFEPKEARWRYFSAIMRHLLSWWRGERFDKDSGLPHLAHAVASLLFLLWFDNNV